MGTESVERNVDSSAGQSYSLHENSVRIDVRQRLRLADVPAGDRMLDSCSGRTADLRSMSIAYLLTASRALLDQELKSM